MSFETVRKKIDILIPDFQDLGAQRVAINIANWLAKKYDVTFVVFAEGGPFRSYLDEKIPVVVLGKRTLNIPKIRVILLLFAYWRHAQSNRTDLAVSFSPGTNYAILLAKLLSPRLKTIIEEHDFPTLFLKDRENVNALYEFFFTHLLVKLYRLSSAFVTSTEAIREEFVKKYGVRNKIFQIIRNPLDIEGISRMAKEPVDDFAFRKDRHYLIGAGRLAEQKNFARLIDIFKEVHEQIPETELIILGRGQLEKPLKERVAALGVKGLVHFMGFKKNPDKYIANADCFCLTSNWEALPQIIAEAMVSRTLVVANDCHAGPSEMIKDGETGILVEYGNIRKFAEKIIWALKHPTEAASIAQKAYEFAEYEYSLKKVGGEYEALIEKLLG